MYATAHEDIVELLVAKGADVNAKDYKGQTVFMQIAWGGGLHTTMDFLISNEADINAKDNGGHTAFMWAALKGDKATMEYLISKGADVSLNKDISDSIIKQSIQKKIWIF